jgi:hypothetical protein
METVRKEKIKKVDYSHLKEEYPPVKFKIDSQDY